jgi:hypothetical protein
MKHLLVACVAAVSVSTLLCVAPSRLPCLAEEPTDAKQDLDGLIAQLGSESFEVREAATRRLMQREEAAPALRRALKSSDSEVARRAREILDALARREKERAFAAFVDAAKRGAVDQAVERFARRQKWDDEAACWRVMAGLADRLTSLERESYKKASLPAYDGVTAPELPVLLKSFRLKTTHAGSGSPALWERRVVLRAEENLEAGRIVHSLLAVCGRAKIDTMNHAVLFTGGPVDFEDSVARSLIVCDGDFTAQNFIFHCLIIARGTIRCEGTVGDSRLISCGKVEFKHPEKVHESKVVENERKPLGFVTFFDPAEAGVKVESAEGGVRVKEAARGKPFAAAGLRAGDVVTALDGSAVKDAEGFRRLLRAKLAVEGTTTFHVRRDQKTMEIPITHKD